MIITKGTAYAGDEVVDKYEAYVGDRLASHSELAKHIADLKTALREIESRTRAYAGDDQNWPLASGIYDVARNALRKT